MPDEVCQGFDRLAAYYYGVPTAAEEAPHGKARLIDVEILGHIFEQSITDLEQLRHAAYDVMVTDIGMEEMDGFDLTAAVRQRPETDGMPILLVSARDSETDRRRGASVGADGFLTKKDCVSGRLLSEVSAVIARRKGLS